MKQATSAVACFRLGVLLSDSMILELTGRRAIAAASPPVLGPAGGEDSW